MISALSAVGKLMVELAAPPGLLLVLNAKVKVIGVKHELGVFGRYDSQKSWTYSHNILAA